MQDVPTTDKKREWSKPTIKLLKMISTRTGTDTGEDEDYLMGPAQFQDINPRAITRYAPISS